MTTYHNSATSSVCSGGTPPRNLHFLSAIASLLIGCSSTPQHKAISNLAVRHIPSPVNVVALNMAHLYVANGKNEKWAEVSLYNRGDFSAVEDKSCLQEASFPQGSISESTILQDCSPHVIYALQKLAIECGRSSTKVTANGPAKADVDKLLVSANEAGKIFVSTSLNTSPSRISSITAAMAEEDESYALEVVTLESDGFMAALYQATKEARDFSIIIGQNEYRVSFNHQVRGIFERFNAACGRP